MGLLFEISCKDIRILTVWIPKCGSRFLIIISIGMAIDSKFP
jgi:hypothetical protein